VTETGFCRNEGCPNAASGEPIELYAGPGKYCPACGEELQPRVPPGAAIGTEDHGNVHARIAAALGPAGAEPRWRFGKNAWAGIAALLVVVALVAAAMVRRPAGPAVNAAIVRVCGSSVSARLAGDVVRTFAAKNGTALSQLDIRPPDSETCDVRFWADAAGAKESVLGHDGVVVVVHPGNPLNRLDENQVRDVFSGRITDWSQLGRRSGAVIALAPEEGSDEAKRLASTLFRGLQVDRRVSRVRNGRDITRIVASAGGANTIGLVAFSEAVPAKVIALGSGLPPSPLTIGSRRYPLSLDIMVGSDLRSPSAAAIAMIDFARSKDGQSIVARNGLVPKEGT
jgi:hypothetical protein